MNPALHRMRSILVGAATALVIVTVAILPFLTPPWLAFEQDRAQVTAWTGLSAAQVAGVTNSIVTDLVIGPPAFDVAVDGQAVLTERERGHMRDVRTVFLGLWALTAAGVVVLTVAARSDRRAFWWSVRRGAAVLAAAVVVAGVIAVVAFEVLFETFHRLLFPSGSYTFDPAEERLVQLFPFQFWQETAIVVGGVIVLLAVLIGWFAGGRDRRAVAVQRPAPQPEAAR